MNTRSLLISVLIAGVLAGVLSSVPVLQLLNCLLCGWLWLGGLFAVWFYRRGAPGTVSTGTGLAIGALTGIVAAVVATILGALINTATASMLTPDMISQLEQVFGDQSDAIIQMIENPAVSIGLTAILDLVFFTLFGAIGGLIGAAIFQTRA